MRNEAESFRQTQHFLILLKILLTLCSMSLDWVPIAQIIFEVGGGTLMNSFRAVS